MGRRVFLATAFVLLGGMAFAQHAISPEPEVTAPALTPAPAAPPVAAAPEPATPPSPVATQEPEAVAEQPAPRVQVMLPAEIDVYLVPVATREVCTTTDFGYGEIRTDCRVRMLPAPPGNPALRGICTTYYGRRTCY